jgi:hypothetical protein
MRPPVNVSSQLTGGLIMYHVLFASLAWFEYEHLQEPQERKQPDSSGSTKYDPLIPGH